MFSKGADDEVFQIQVRPLSTRFINQMKLAGPICQWKRNYSPMELSLMSGEGSVRPVL